MIAPPSFWASKMGTVALIVFHTPVRLTSIWSWNCSSVSSHSGAVSLRVPAFATTMSRCPSSDTPAATADSMPARSNVDLAGEYAPTAACDQVDGGNKIVRVSERIGHGVDLLTDIDGNDVGALLGQAQCVGAALPTCGACDEGYLALQSGHLVRSPNQPVATDRVVGERYWCCSRARRSRYSSARSSVMWGRGGKSSQPETN